MITAVQCEGAGVGGSVFQAKGAFRENPTGRSWFHTHPLCEAAGSVASMWHGGDRGSDEAHDSSATSSCCPQGLCQGRGQCLSLLPLPQVAQPVPGDTRDCDTTGVGDTCHCPQNQRVWWEEPCLGLSQGFSPSAHPHLYLHC